jgi:cobalt-zinc-cadmium efflux system protein
MGHDHSHHHHHHGTDSTRNITVAFWLNTAFSLIEVAGGLYTNSVAILSDALHDFGDSLSLGLAWYFQKKSQKKRDEVFSYGYKRFSLLGALITSVVLVTGSVFVLQESVERLLNPTQPDAKGMLVFALLGIGVNLAAMLRLRKGDTLTEKAVSLHFLEDVLGWVAVLVGSIVMLFVQVPILDPILSIVISCFILFNIYKNLKAAFRIILQAIPENINEQEIRDKVLRVAGVSGIHDIHVWTMDGQYNVLTLHVVAKDASQWEEIEEIKNNVRHCLQHLNLQHITIEMESEKKHCELRDC